MLRRIGIESSLLGAVVQINEVQKRWAFEVLLERFEGDFSGRTIAVWGLAFKPETDDLREAPAKILIEQLLGAGAKVLAHDPAAMPRARSEWPVQWFESGNLQLTEDPYAVMDGADALVLVTEWKPFRAPDFHSIKARMNGKLIVDGRNQYDPVQLRSQGFDYCGVGRGTLLEPLAESAMQPQLQRDRTPLVNA
jgi:UDPglucose 6-dehydrogenase